MSTVNDVNLTIEKRNDIMKSNLFMALYYIPIAGLILFALTIDSFFDTLWEWDRMSDWMSITYYCIFIVIQSVSIALSFLTVILSIVIITKLI